MSRPMHVRRYLAPAVIAAGLVLAACTPLVSPPAATGSRSLPTPMAASAGAPASRGAVQDSVAPRPAAPAEPATSAAAGDERSRSSRIGLAVLVVFGLLGLSLLFGG